MGVDLIANEEIMSYSEINCNIKNAIIQKKLHLKKNAPKVHFFVDI
tara:strand:- start:642 stop:779 length:138 start_codon:yes stop_codon:yes gene_type:complete